MALLYQCQRKANIAIRGRFLTTSLGPFGSIIFVNSPWELTMLIGGYPGHSCVVVLKWISGSSERKKIYEPESEAAPPEHYYEEGGSLKTKCKV